jgi:predicted kinase
MNESLNDEKGKSSVPDPPSIGKLTRSFSNAKMAELSEEHNITVSVPNKKSENKMMSEYNPIPQAAPGASAANLSVVDNSIPLSIFPIATDKFCICFCGLPGRGKTHISRRLAKYLSFFHAVNVELFNVSEYRRRVCGALKDAEWFNPENIEATQLRHECNKMAIDDMVSYLNSSSQGVVIFDATNHTIERRADLVEKIKPTGAKILWIEVSNDNEIGLTEIYKTAATTSPDYEGMVYTIELNNLIYS